MIRPPAASVKVARRSAADSARGLVDKLGINKNREELPRANRRRNSTPALAIEGRAASRASSISEAQIRFLEIQFDGLGEIEKCLHRAIKAVDFICPASLQPAAARRSTGIFALRTLEPQAHGVRGILHFVGDAGSLGPEGRQPLGHLEMTADAFKRFVVAQDNKCPGPQTILAHSLHAQAHAARSSASLERHFFSLDRFDFLALDS